MGWWFLQGAVMIAVLWTFIYMDVRDAGLAPAAFAVGAAFLATLAVRWCLDRLNNLRAKQQRANTGDARGIPERIGRD